MFDRLRSYLRGDDILGQRSEQGAPEDRALYADGGPGLRLGPLLGGGGMTPQRGLQVGVVWACVKALSDAAASLPLIPYRRRRDGTRERVESSRLGELLDRPGPGTTQAALVATIVAHLTLWGNCYISKLRPGGNLSAPVEQLWPLPPDRVLPELRRGQLRFTYTDYEGRQHELDERSIIHVKALSLDGLVGLSPIAQARTEILLGRTLTESALRFHSNDSSPRGLLKVPSTQLALDRDAERSERPGHFHPAAAGGFVDDLRSQWESVNRGVANAGRIGVVTGDVDFLPISMSAEDAQLVESRGLSAQEIARIFRCPGWIVNAPTGDSMTYSNVAEQKRAFIEFSVTPWLVLIEQALTNDRDLSPPGVYCEFLLDAALRPDAATRASVYSAALAGAPYMSVEEVRRAENLDPRQSPPPQPTPPPAQSNGNVNGREAVGA